MATPILQDLRAAFPKASITAMCKRPIAELLEKDPHIDELFTFTKEPSNLRRIRGAGIVEKVKEGKFDLGVLLTNSLSSAWWFWAADVKHRVGFAKLPRSSLVDLKAVYPLHEQHQVQTYKAILARIGIPPSATKPMLYLSDDEKIDLGYEKVVGINPGAAYGSAKCWLPERFSEVTRRLVDEGYHVIYFGDHTTVDMVNEICAPFDGRVINMCGKTSIRQLMGMMSQCDVFLSNDSGPMHIAAALQIPLVALFGSTSEVKTGPYGWGEVIHKHVECSPCYKRECPIDFRCMRQIEVDEVMEKIQSLEPALC